MANPRFEAIIRALWARLGLPAPVFGDDDLVMLTVDGIAIRLAQSRDGGSVLVSGSPGRLAADPFAQGVQVTSLLKANLGFLVGNPAGLLIEEGDPAPLVRIEAAHSYAGGSDETLMHRVEDVLQRIEFHRHDLATAPAPRPVPASADAARGEFIFRL